MTIAAQLRRDYAATRARLWSPLARVYEAPPPRWVDPCVSIAVLSVLYEAGPQRITFIAAACGLDDEHATARLIIERHLADLHIVRVSRGYALTKAGHDALAEYEAGL